MKLRIFSTALLSLMFCFSACQSQPEYCTVKGTVKGLKDGTKLVLQDQFDHYKDFVSTRVKDGTYEFHPRISAPTHVYLYTNDGKQLKDFFLEPGTVVADVDATDKDDWAACATGTPTNDLYSRIHQLNQAGDYDACQALWIEAANAEQTDILALYYADGSECPAVQGLKILDNLSPDLAAKPYVAELREKLTLRAEVEPAPEGSGKVHYYIDIEYADVNGNPVSLSSVVNNPANRLVILDFWATWCGPCREAIPGLQELYAKYHGKGLEIYAVSEDPYENEWKDFLKEANLPWIQVLDNQAGRNSQAKKDYVFSGIPLPILIDGETGAILVRNDRREMERVIADMLDRN